MYVVDIVGQLTSSILLANHSKKKAYSYFPHLVISGYWDHMTAKKLPQFSRCYYALIGC